MIQIHDLRLSFIWTETFLDLIRAPDSGAAPFAFLARRSWYSQRFEQALGGGDVPGDLEQPWPRPSGQYFWTYYLEGSTPGHITGVRAWKALVPFRGGFPATVSAPWLGPGRLMLEGYFYPHGVALVLTSACLSSLTLEEAVGKAFEVRRTGRFEVDWRGRAGSEPLSLDALAGKGLTALRTRAFGEGAAPGDRSVTPFTVATVVRGSGVDPGAPLEEGGAVHRALEALTTWRPTWQYDVLPELSAVSLAIRTAPPSHVLYGCGRGRAVWFPALFAREGGDLRSLSCYHRNLVMASLQVESLGGLVSATARQIRGGTALSPAHRECARRAAGILGRLHGGVETYKSSSPPAHIEQNDLIPPLNRVRDYFNMPPVS
jgi:hypothetical protein